MCVGIWLSMYVSVSVSVIECVSLCVLQCICHYVYVCIIVCKCFCHFGCVSLCVYKRVCHRCVCAIVYVRYYWKVFRDVLSIRICTESIKKSVLLAKTNFIYQNSYFFWKLKVIIQSIFKNYIDKKHCLNNWETYYDVKLKKWCQSNCIFTTYAF